MRSYLEIVAFLLALVSLGSALDCFQCNSNVNDDCIDLKPGSKNYLSPCNKENDNTNYTVCRKLHMYMDQDFGEVNPAQDRVHRACGYLPDDGIKKRDGCYYKSGYNTRTWVCTCDYDECNSAHSLKLNVPLALSLLLTPLAMYAYARA